jgi:type II secretory pathway component GspD/PulD (secretin)
MTARVLSGWLVPVVLLAGLAPVAACPPAEDRPKDTTVFVEVRFITTAEDFFDRIGVDFNGGGDKATSSFDAAPTVLDAGQVRKLLEAAQGDLRTNVLQAPRLMVADGKAATLRSCEHRYFLTGIERVRRGEQITLMPKNEAVSTGFELSIRPRVTADRRAVSMHLETSLTSLDSEAVPLVPVVIPVTPAGEKGAGKPAVLTQYLQQPRFTTLALDKELTIPDGGTVLVGGWKRLTERRQEYGPPVLSKVPYVNRLFKKVGYSRSSENVLVMVTARIVPGPEQEARQTSTPCPKATAAVEPIVPCRAEEPACPHRDKRLAKLLARYHKACAAGRPEEAKEWARRALDLDPTCFDQHLLRPANAPGSP